MWSAITPVFRRVLGIELVWFAMAVSTAHAQSDLTALKIEGLMNVDVTSAAKKAQKISRVPAAILVITQEDIERSLAPPLITTLCLRTRFSHWNVHQEYSGPDLTENSNLVRRSADAWLTWRL